MSFDLKVGRNTIVQLGEPVIECVLELGEDRERFLVPVSFWSRDFYISQWKKSFSEGINNRRHSALITSMRNPLKMNFVFLWVLFYEGEEVVIQNKILFFDEIGGDFQVDKINEYIDDRVSFNDDGQKISEWTVPLVEVFACFENLG